MSQAALINPGPDSSGISYEQFLREAPAGAHLEWVNGKVVAMTPVSDAHARVGTFLINVLATYVESKRLGRVLYEPFQMKTAPDLPGRSPDIMFVAAANYPRIHDTYLEGPADLAIEIISPGSQTVDRGEKYYEYEKGGVKEYWILDPQRKRAEFYHLDEEGLYATLPVGEDDMFTSREIAGCTLKVAWLWPGQMPLPLDVLRSWKLI
jgi:Uma2 family endonuclease